jgi:carboxymethylenebutenolidase
MKRRQQIKLLLLAIWLMPSALPAQDWAKARLEKSPRHLEWVKVKHDNREVNCFVAYPEVKDKATVVVVIHEIFGLTDWARTVADQLAEAGYMAIAPDLLSGAAPGGGGTAELGGMDAVRKAISSLPRDQVTADLKAVADYVTKLPACNGKVAVAGFCWGGGEAFRFATEEKPLQAAFVFYGIGPDNADAIAHIPCPVYGFYGGNDARVTASVPKTTELMKAAGKTYEPVIYKDAGHGFMRAGEAPDATAANKAAHDQAWEHWKSLLKKI